MTDTLIIDPASEIWSATLDLADYKFGMKMDWYTTKRPWRRLLWYLRDNSAVVTQLGGDTGTGKTFTAMTSRGRIFFLDVDNQFYLYAYIDRFKDRVAKWRYSMDPVDYTREAITAWLKETDISRPFDVIITAREGEEFDKQGGSTGRIKNEGEQRKTRYEVPFQFRMDTHKIAGGVTVNRATCTKSKVEGLRVGDEFDNPDLNTIYTECGVYAYCDMAYSLMPKMGDEPDRATAAEQLLGEASGRALSIKDKLLDAITKDLTKARSPENIRLFNSLPEADKAEVKALVAKLSGGR